METKSSKKVILHIFFGAFVFSLLISVVSLSVQNVQLKREIAYNQLVLSPTPTMPIATVVPTRTEPTNKPTSKPVVIPNDWREYSGKDSYYGVSVTMSIPSGYKFQCSGSECMIFSDDGAAEIWDYSASRDYDNGSRRAWYQKYLNGDYMETKSEDFQPGKITSVVEHQIGDKSYLELVIDGRSHNYAGEVGTHYLYIQNNIAHIFKPSSHKAGSDPTIPDYIGQILYSLKSEPYDSPY